MANIDTAARKVQERLDRAKAIALNNNDDRLKNNPTALAILAQEIRIEEDKTGPSQVVTGAIPATKSLYPEEKQQSEEE